MVINSQQARALVGLCLGCRFMPEPIAPGAGPTNLLAELHHLLRRQKAQRKSLWKPPCGPQHILNSSGSWNCHALTGNKPRGRCHSIKGRRLECMTLYNTCIRLVHIKPEGSCDRRNVITTCVFQVVQQSSRSAPRAPNLACHLVNMPRFPDAAILLKQAIILHLHHAVQTKKCYNSSTLPSGELAITTTVQNGQSVYHITHIHL
jgi:hypothetical protein